MLQVKSSFYIEKCICNNLTLVTMYNEWTIIHCCVLVYAQNYCVTQRCIQFKTQITTVCWLSCLKFEKKISFQSYFNMQKFSNHHMEDNIWKTTKIKHNLQFQRNPFSLWSFAKSRKLQDSSVSRLTQTFTPTIQNLYLGQQYLKSKNASILT